MRHYRRSRHIRTFHTIENINQFKWFSLYYEYMCLCSVSTIFGMICCLFYNVTKTLYYTVSQWSNEALLCDLPFIGAEEGTFIDRHLWGSRTPFSPAILFFENMWCFPSRHVHDQAVDVYKKKKEKKDKINNKGRDGSQQGVFDPTQSQQV